MTNCIFCKIIAGDIPCAKIYEDDNTIAFLDIAPCSDGHTLVIPKKHYQTLDECDNLTVAAVAQTLTLVARAIKKAFGVDYNIVSNNGGEAGQEVPHLHFHIIPCQQGRRRINFASHGQYAPGQMEAVKQAIAKEL